MAKDKTNKTAISEEILAAMLKQATENLLAAMIAQNGTEIGNKVARKAAVVARAKQYAVTVVDGNGRKVSANADTPVRAPENFLSWTFNQYDKYMAECTRLNARGYGPKSEIAKKFFPSAQLAKLAGQWHYWANKSDNAVAYCQLDRMLQCIKGTPFSDTTKFITL